MYVMLGVSQCPDGHLLDSYLIDELLHKAGVKTSQCPDGHLLDSYSSHVAPGFD